MPDVNERLDGVEQTLKTLTEHVKEQFTNVKEQFANVEEQFTKLRMLGEENTAQIKVIAEVQVHHGQKLQQLVEAVEPLKVLPTLYEQVARDHERRIRALEDASSTSRPTP